MVWAEWAIRPNLGKEAIKLKISHVEIHKVATLDFALVTKRGREAYLVFFSF